MFFFQAEDGIRDLVRSRGLGDVYKRQNELLCAAGILGLAGVEFLNYRDSGMTGSPENQHPCLLYTSDAADERSSVDLGGRRIIKKKTKRT